MNPHRKPATGALFQAGGRRTSFDRAASAGDFAKRLAATDEELSSIAVPNADAADFADAAAGARSGAQMKLAFAGLFFFTLLLYARPQEMFPEAFGSFPLVRLVAIGTLLAYVGAKLVAGERLTRWTLELTMILVIVFLGILFMPIAASPGDSLGVLLDTFLKVVVIFVLMINLLNTESRLRSIIRLSVICGTGLALFAVFSYATGNYLVQNRQATNRIASLVAGMFGNPNDLAVSLDLLLPLAVALALTSAGIKRLFYIACAVALAIGVIVTFSRGGFLGLVAVGGVLLWKLSRRRRGLTVLAFVVATGVFLVAMPAGYSNRLTTIFSIEEDPTGSAQARRELLTRAAAVAANHLVIGVGMGNFHIYSIREQVAHNSYLEISAELGVAGLLAYLALIFAPFAALRRIERQTRSRPTKQRLPYERSRDGTAGDERTPADDVVRQRAHIFSVALQAAIIGYLVCSFFGSIQYLWHIYYLVAYAVALRQLRPGAQPIEQPVGIALHRRLNRQGSRQPAVTTWQTTDKAAGKAKTPATSNARSGALWKAHQRAAR